MITYREMLKQVAGKQYEPVYIFFGNEKFLQEDLLSRLVSSYLGPEASFGLEKLDGREHELEAVVERIGDRGLFASRRLLVVDNPLYLESPRKRAGKDEQNSADESAVESREQKGLELLSDFLEGGQPSVPESVLVFLSPEPDRRKRLFKLVEKKGMVVECSSLKGEALASWIRARALALGKKIDRAAVEKLLLAGDTSLHYLTRELEKYALYLGDDEEIITADTVDTLFSGDLQGNVFKLADALSRGKTEQAGKLVELLLSKREPPLLILFMLARHYRLLLKANSLIYEDQSGVNLASALAVPPFAARKIKEQSALYNRRVLEDIMVVLQDEDRRLKTGRIDPGQALQLIIGRIDYIQKSARSFLS